MLYKYPDVFKRSHIKYENFKVINVRIIYSIHQQQDMHSKYCINF
jgi:hypothetical protein